jgi:hypothetical protein|tara:strand:- start:203 stop:379 length:177 start_codon:yes stop_codon:yes gene_type:complete
MAVLDVEGSKFTKELTGKHKEWWMKNTKFTTFSASGNRLFVRMDAVEVANLLDKVGEK